MLDDVKVHYDERGIKYPQAVIIMHGWGCSHTTMESVVCMLENKFHLFNIDLPGHGESDEPPSTWGVHEYADLIENFIVTFSIENPIIIGHSFGGRIGIVLASRQNDIKKMVLIDAAGVKPKRSLKYYIKVYGYKFVKKTLPLFLGKHLGSQIIDSYRKKTGSADYNAATPIMRTVMSKCVNEDLRYAMPNIKCPTLLIWGENDTTTPISDARIMENLIPDAGLVSFPHCGHFSFLENRNGVKIILEEFLREELPYKS